MLYLGTVLHDVGLSSAVGGTERFEVRGANAVRELLLEHGMSPERAREFARSIDQTELDFVLDEIPRAGEQAAEGVTRVTEIVRAMKDFARSDNGEPIMTDINALALSITTIGRHEWKYVATLETSLDPDLPWIPCHSGEVGQALLNVIVNGAASIAARRGNDLDAPLGRIEMSTRRYGSGVEIRVSDSGVGIAREIRDRIFDPFFTTRPGEASGQGLTYVHAVIVQRHGGSVKVESEPGQGATFVLRLPGRVRAAGTAEAI